MRLGNFLYIFWLLGKDLAFVSFREAIYWFLEGSAGPLRLLSVIRWPGRPAPAFPAKPTALPVRTVELIARQQPSHGEYLALNQEIPMLLDSAGRLARPRGCRLEYAVAPGLLVNADRRAFREAMAGLLAHTIIQNPGGQVLVAAGRQPGVVQISVTDDGVGADAATQQRQLREPIRLLEQLRGAVSIAPHTGQGTVVTVRLPESTGTAATTMSTGVAEPSLAHG